MFKDTRAFSGFSVQDLEVAKAFYGDKLGLDIAETPQGLILKIAGDENGIFVYPKPDHAPASFTILNFPVDDIDASVQALTDKGVTFEHYPDFTDDKGIARGIAEHRGPDIAWFKDPFGNILSILHDAPESDEADNE
jgi:catechol 2,3-dioxygenase-like lactoylglutathione lyase family enzyme